MLKIINFLVGRNDNFWFLASVFFLIFICFYRILFSLDWLSDSVLFLSIRDRIFIYLYFNKVLGNL